MLTIEKAHQEFITHLKSKDRAQATILAYGKDIQQLLTHIKNLGHNKIQTVQKENLEDFLKKLEKEGYTKKSISRKINSMKTFFRFLKISEYITDDPASLITHPKFETPAPRILSPMEYRALRDAAKEDIRTLSIIEVLLQTGVRIGELAEIRMQNVKLDEKTEKGILTVPESRATLGRDLPLNSAAVQALRVYLKTRPKAKSNDEYFFITRTGKPLLIRNIRASIDRYFKKSDIQNASVHSLRHTWIAHHIKKGASLLLVSKLAGHKRLSTTEKYLKYVEPATKEKLALEEL